MRKRGQQRSRRAAHVPLILAYDKVSLRNHIAGAELIKGTATEGQWDVLAGAYNLLAVGSKSIGRADIVALCDVVGEILIASRPQLVAGQGKALPESEAEVLRQFLVCSDNFWKAQGVGRYNECINFVLNRTKTFNVPPGSFIPADDKPGNGC